MTSPSNIHCEQTQELVPYLLFLYQKELRECRRDPPKVINKCDIKYNLTKELVRTNLTYVKKTPERIGSNHGGEFCKMLQELKHAKLQKQQSMMIKAKKT